MYGIQYRPTPNCYSFVPRFVDRVDQDRPVARILNNVVENLISKPMNAASRDEKVQPRMWHVPEAFFAEFDLGHVDPVQEIYIRDFRREEGGLDVVESRQKGVHFLHQSAMKRS